MPDKLSCLQAYKTMVHLFDAIYFSIYDDDLGGYLGSSSIYSANEGECPKTWDPAYWEDWMEAVKVVMQDESITYDSIELTVEQSYAAMHQYLVTYCDVGSGLTMKRLRDLTNKDIDQSELMQFLSTLWSRSLSIILEQNSYEKDKIGFDKKTCLDKREAFQTMRFFLDMVCQKNYNTDLIKIVQNSRLKNESDYWASVPDIIEPKILQLWQQAIDDTLLQEQGDKINLLIAYKAMPLFLTNFFNNNRSDFISMMIEKFEMKDDLKPQFSFYWISWLSAAVSVNAQQVEKINNLTSVKMSVSQGVALKIIKAWFESYKDQLEVSFVLDTSILIWQQAVDGIKSNKRSYLLGSNEITILETYHIMLKLLEIHNKKIPEFEIDPTEVSIDINLMLNWIRICEQVIREKTN